MNSHYFTVITDPDKEKSPVVPDGVNVDVVGLREAEMTENPDYLKRKIVTTMNMFFNKGFDDVCYIAPNTLLRKFPSELYDTPDSHATVYKHEKVVDSGVNVRAVWDVAPQSYLVDNMVHVRSKAFAEEWLKMTFKPFFQNYNGHEMDVLNMLVYYGDYRVRVRDLSEL